MAVDVKMRYNPEAGEVELVVGDKVAATTGKDVFDSWAQHWATTNGYTNQPPTVNVVASEPVTVPAPEPVEEPPVTPPAPVEPPAVDSAA
jgi:hypothetical protein